MAKTKSSSEKANTIIKNHMALSMGAGMIPIPIVDFVAVSAIQIDMIRVLGNVYDIKFEENQVKAVISALTGTGIARLGAGFVKVIPGIGTLLGGLTFSAISGASTYALGEVFKKHFETGGNFLDLNIENFKDFYKEKFDQGKDMAKDVEKQQNGSGGASDTTEEEIVIESIENVPVENQQSGEKIENLKKIAKLLKDGVITEKEFKKMKKEIIG